MSNRQKHNQRVHHVTSLAVLLQELIAEILHT